MQGGTFRLRLKPSRIALAVVLLSGAAALLLTVLAQMPVWASALTLALIAILLWSGAARERLATPADLIIRHGQFQRSEAGVNSSPIALRVLSYWDLSPWLLIILLTDESGKSPWRLLIWRDSCDRECWRHIRRTLYGG